MALLLLSSAGAHATPRPPILRSAPHRFSPQIARSRRLGRKPPPRLCSLRPTVAKAVPASVLSPRPVRIAPWTGSAAEVAALEDLRARLASCGDPWAADGATQRWFLRDRRFDAAAAEDKIRKTAKWRREFGIDGLSRESAAREAATGKAFVHEHRDVAGRPVMVIRAGRHVTGEFPVASSQRLTVLTLEETLARLPEGGETVLAVFDLRGFGPANADLGLVRFMVALFFVHYPKRLGQVALVEAPWVFRPFWELVKPLLFKYAQLVRFVSREELRREYFAPGQSPIG